VIFQDFFNRVFALKPKAKPSKDIDVLINESLKKPFRFAIDIVDACNLKCVNCPRGVYYKNNTSKMMELNVFKRLMDRIASVCECEEVLFYNWTEPFLHPELDKFIQTVNNRGIKCGLSSNLSFSKPRLLESVLMQSPALVVSVSGFEQSTHQLYHKGADINKVKANLKYIYDFKNRHNPALHVEVHCLQFVYNQEDQSMWEQFCADHGFLYMAKPAYHSEAATPEEVERLLWKPEFDKLPNGKFKVKSYLSKIPIAKSCNLHNTIPLDCLGDIYLCCIYWNRKEFKIGNLYNSSLSDIQRRRLSLHECAYCTALRSS
jgi:pyruvate-formate lyase-activating enzyme